MTLSTVSVLALSILSSTSVLALSTTSDSDAFSTNVSNWSSCSNRASNCSYRISIAYLTTSGPPMMILMMRKMRPGSQKCHLLASLFTFFSQLIHVDICFLPGRTHSNFLFLCASHILFLHPRVRHHTLNSHVEVSCSSQS